MGSPVLLSHAVVVTGYVVIVVRMVAFDCPWNLVTAFGGVGLHIVVLLPFLHWVIAVVETC